MPGPLTAMPPWLPTPARAPLTVMLPGPPKVNPRFCPVLLSVMLPLMLAPAGLVERKTASYGVLRPFPIVSELCDVTEIGEVPENRNPLTGASEACQCMPLNVAAAALAGRVVQLQRVDDRAKPTNDVVPADKLSLTFALAVIAFVCSVGLRARTPTAGSYVASKVPSPVALVLTSAPRNTAALTVLRAPAPSAAARELAPETVPAPAWFTVGAVPKKIFATPLAGVEPRFVPRNTGVE